VILAVIGQRLPSLSLSEKELSIKTVHGAAWRKRQEFCIGRILGFANCILGAAFLGFRAILQALDILDIDMISGYMGDT
jgi:hypothetical protein